MDAFLTDVEVREFIEQLPTATAARSQSRQPQQSVNERYEGDPGVHPDMSNDSRVADEHAQTNQIEHQAEIRSEVTKQSTPHSVQSPHASDYEDNSISASEKHAPPVNQERSMHEEVEEEAFLQNLLKRFQY